MGAAITPGREVLSKSRIMDQDEDGDLMLDTSGDNTLFDAIHSATVLTEKNKAAALAGGPWL